MIAIRRSQPPRRTTHPEADQDTSDGSSLVCGSLRLIRQDYPRSRQAPRPADHDNNEIISYVVEGPLVNPDNVVEFRPNRMCEVDPASGEMTPCQAHDEKKRGFLQDSMRLLQIWILREEPGLDPATVSCGGLRLLASGDGRDDSLRMQKDIDLYSTRLENGEHVVHNLRHGRCAWVQVVRGTLEVNGRRLKTGDGAGISDEEYLCLEGSDAADVLLFDVA